MGHGTNKYQRLGIIESNRQIVRNESGETIHKEFAGTYVPPIYKTENSDSSTNDGDSGYPKFLFKKGDRIWDVAISLLILAILIIVYRIGRLL